MSKAGKLAGLAALAGAAYMMGKDKDGSPKGKEDTGPGYKSTETRNDEGATADKKTKSDVLDAITAPKEKSNDAAGNQGVLSSKSDKPTSVSAPKSVSKPAASSSKSTASSTVSEAGTSRGTRPADSSKAYPSGVMGGSRQADKKPSTADTVKKVALDTAKAAAKTATQGPATSATSAASPAMRETYRDLSGKVQYKTPSGPSASQTVSDAVSSGAKKVGSGIADYVKNFETPAERRAREAKNPSPKTSSTRDYNEDALSSGSAMKRGGAVKKMASGGMTASRRADGIASRGKTRCKMY